MRDYLALQCIMVRRIDIELQKGMQVLELLYMAFFFGVIIEKRSNLVVPR